jgi:small conductance mechanosensitive channel
MLEIGVSYKEDVDKVMAVLLELGTQLIDDKEFGSLIIGEMEMLGVDKFADSAIVIKLLIKTYPLKQWIIKREMLRRIKNKFDELGIEIPFPHLTVYHRKPEEQLLSTS